MFAGDGEQRLTGTCVLVIAKSTCEVVWWQMSICGGGKKPQLGGFQADSEERGLPSTRRMETIVNSRGGPGPLW